MTEFQTKFPAVILAGGLSRRMGGGDKCLCHLAGRPILDHVTDRLTPQVGQLALNANGDPARFAETCLPVLPDPLPDHPGPLAGILAALDWAASNGAQQVVTVTADLPFLPVDLVSRLVGSGRQACHARSFSNDHPTVGIWPVSAAPGLRAYLGAGHRRVMDWVKTLDAGAVDFDGTPDPFFNINTPEDLSEARQFLDV